MMRWRLTYRSDQISYLYTTGIMGAIKKDEFFSSQIAIPINRPRLLIYTLAGLPFIPYILSPFAILLHFVCILTTNIFDWQFFGFLYVKRTLFARLFERDTERHICLLFTFAPIKHSQSPL